MAIPLGPGMSDGTGPQIVRTADDLEAVREAIATRDRPLLVEIKLDPHRMPFW